MTHGSDLNGIKFGVFYIVIVLGFSANLTVFLLT